ncbi:flavin reductase family protein [Asanoa iriomotensis]|uniref:Flavin reductase n=1 Tax=Asanoa iriomotensis TaxID=234613 RepID=A0ABQ4C6Z7_9ACTN|nr:flavin reductase family protein [Asanoa iriomotensis]GIF58558.1 flavin reductase [Asanoa iriomotensis]
MADSWRKLPGAKAYRVLESGPTILVSTRNKAGRADLMTVGFHMVISHEGVLAAVISPGDFSQESLAETGECVIGVPGVDLAEQVVDIGNCSGFDVDKFERFALTEKKARHVKAPLVAECLANVECTVLDDSLADAYSGLVILQARQVWINTGRAEHRTFHHNGDGTFNADGDLVDLRDRMVLWKAYQD